MKIRYNPYDLVDFKKVHQVNAITHEHIFSEEQLKNAYDRGIRVFACVNYFPSVPSFPLSAWDNTFDDWEDITKQKKITRHYKGSVPTFTDKDGNVINSDDLPQLGNAEHANMPIDSEHINIVPNHHNVLGTLHGEPGVWKGNANVTVEPYYQFPDGWRYKKENYCNTIANAIVQHKEHNQFGKLFATINHTFVDDNVHYFLDNFPEFYNAFELHNQGYSKAWNEEFRKCYDRILSEGYILFGVSVVDWQGDRATWDYTMPYEKEKFQKEYDNLSPEEQAKFGSVKGYYLQTKRECPDKDRGCNVLLVDDSYDILPHSKCEQERAEKALDIYIKGQYYASGWGNHRINQFEPINDLQVKFSVSDNPSKLVLKTNTRTIETTSPTATIDIDLHKDLYVRGEAYYADKDFIFTNPIFLEPIKEDGEDESLLLLF